MTTLELSNAQTQRTNAMIEQYYTLTNMKMAQHCGRGYHNPPSYAQRLGLLQLRVWTQRYKLPVDVLLDILIPCWRRKLNCPVPIQNLISSRSEFLLQAAIKRRYPENQHLEIWRALCRSVYLRSGTVVTALDKENPESFGSSYATCVRHQRDVNEKRLELFKRRRYPGNPWL